VDVAAVGRRHNETTLAPLQGLLDRPVNKGGTRRRVGPICARIPGRQAADRWDPRCAIAGGTPNAVGGRLRLALRFSSSGGRGAPNYGGVLLTSPNRTQITPLAHPERKSTTLNSTP